MTMAAIAALEVETVKAVAARPEEERTRQRPGDAEPESAPDAARAGGID